MLTIASCTAGGLKPPNETGIAPEDYQLDLASRLVYGDKRELIAAMEMGTGKTLSAILTMTGMLASNPNLKVLVMCPSSLVQLVWKPELQKYTTLGNLVKLNYEKKEIPIESGAIYVSSYSSMSKLYRSGWKWEEKAEPYTDARGALRFKSAWVKRDGNAFLESTWDLVIMDESHTVRNWDEKVSLGRACAIATRGAQKVLMLTGTPIQNTPLDILGQMVASNHTGLLSNKEFYGSHGMVRSRVCNELSKYVFRISLDDANLVLPTKHMHTVFVDHGLKDDDLLLYNKKLGIAQDVYLEMADGKPSPEAMAVLRNCMQVMRRLSIDPAVQHYYGTKNKKGEPAFTAETAELALPRLCPKLREVVRLYNELTKTHSKVVISSDSVSALKLVQHALHREGTMALLYDGTLNPTEKERIVREFLGIPERRCLLLSMIAGGEGLNLVPGPTAMIVCSFWYNPARHRQLEARIYRRGQTHETHIYNIMAKGTIDEAIVKLHEDKQRCSDLLMSLSQMAQGAGAGDKEWKRFGKIVSICNPLKPERGCVDYTTALPREDAKRQLEQILPKEALDKIARLL